MDKYFDLYRKVGTSKAGVPTDWAALIGKIESATLITAQRTNCTIRIPEEAIGALDILLKTEYRGVVRKEHRTAMSRQKVYRQRW